MIVACASVILGADAYFFYLAIIETGWGGTAISFTAILATAAYVVVLLFVSLVSVNLKESIQQLREEESR